MKREKQFFMWKTSKGRKTKGLIQEFKHKENYVAIRESYKPPVNPHGMDIIFSCRIHVPHNLRLNLFTPNPKDQSMTNSNPVLLVFAANNGETLTGEFESLFQVHNGIRANT